jgi:NAD-dependent oxidoreductase involved in siderophore biosynthesis
MTDQPSQPADTTLDYLRDFDPRSVDEVPAGTPFCFYVSGTLVPQDGQEGLIPSIVYENISGHFPLSGGKPDDGPWVWGPSYAEAKQQEREANERIGVSPERAMDIVSSSFRTASDQGKL